MFVTILLYLWYFSDVQSILYEKPTTNKKKNLWEESAGLEGFEPPANRLRADCSSLAELQALWKESIWSNIRYYLGLTMG
jgi:hypothetical protein